MHVKSCSETGKARRLGGIHFLDLEDGDYEKKNIKNARKQLEILMEIAMLSLDEMEELKKFQSSTFDTIARIKLVEDRDTILELTGKIQDLQNEINCMNDSRDFQDAESIRSGLFHVTSQPVSFPPHPIPEGMLEC